MISTIGINSGNALASRVGKMVEFMGNQCVRDLIIKKNLVKWDSLFYCFNEDIEIMKEGEMNIHEIQVYVI